MELEFSIWFVFRLSREKVNSLALFYLRSFTLKTADCSHSNSEVNLCPAGTGSMTSNLLHAPVMTVDKLLMESWCRKDAGKRKCICAILICLLQACAAGNLLNQDGLFNWPSTQFLLGLKSKNGILGFDFIRSHQIFVCNIF